MGMRGLMYMLTRIFQGIWLPIHGYRYAVTPLWAGIYMLPMPISMGIFGVLSSRLALLSLVTLTYDFSYIVLSISITIYGIGYGIFNVPNFSEASSTLNGFLKSDIIPANRVIPNPT